MNSREKTIALFEEIGKLEDLLFSTRDPEKLKQILLWLISKKRTLSKSSFLFDMVQSDILYAIEVYEELISFRDNYLE